MGEMREKPQGSSPCNWLCALGAIGTAYGREIESC